jgi:hypothetical protein
MRSLITFAVAAALLTGLQGTTSEAQARGTNSAPETVAANYWSGAPQWQGSGLPYGSYQQTCRNIHNNGSRLDATCQKANGDWHNTSINYRGCRGQIVNENGNLRCVEGGYNGGWQGGGHGGLPHGDYKLTCQNIHMDGNRLSASCQKKNGEWRNTNLNNAYQCRSIVNDDGHLRCTY